MKYRLYYNNHFGYTHNPDGSICDNRKDKHNPQEFDSLELATFEANKFIKANPLLECVIVYPNNRIITIADSESQIDEYKKEIKYYKKIQKSKKRIIFIFVIFILIIVFSLIYLNLLRLC